MPLSFILKLNITFCFKLGGIRSFVADKDAVLKWCLNSPEQTKNTAELKRITGLSCDNSVYKQLRPSYILQFERVVTETVRVIAEEYLNPFGVNLEHSSLYNLSSGVALPNDIGTDDMLQCYSKGKELMAVFNERLVHGDKKFHDPISRNTIKSFKTASRSKVIEKNNTVSTIRVNWDIIGALLSFSAKHDKPIDWDSVLTYPLSPIPLSFSTADGNPRKTSKSKLLEVIFKEGRTNLTDNPRDATLAIRNESTFIIDLIPALRSMVQIPQNYEELTWKLLNTFPRGHA